MKKILFSVLALVALNGYAQKFRVETASIAIRNYENPASTKDDRKAAMEEGKAEIDKAAENPESQSDPKMWYNRGVIYQYIISDTAVGINVPNGGVIAMEAYIKCIKLDDKKAKYSVPARTNLTNYIAYVMNMKANQAFNNKDYVGSLNYYKKILEIIQYDTDKNLSKNNMSDKELYWNMAVIAINGELNKEAKEYLQAAIDKGYQDPNAFVYLANIYLTEGDTASGLKVIEQGRSNFPNTSSLITAEINVYIAQGRVDVLVEKANAAIENSPDNPLLYYVRGNSYQILAESNAKLVKRTNDTLAYFAKQLKSATDPKKKAALTAKQTDFKSQLSKQSADYATFLSSSEKDYLKTIELDGGMFDAHFNLGALYLNQTPDLTEKMNNLPVSAEKEYNDTKAKRDALYKKAIPSFEKALEVVKNPKDEYDICNTLKQVYGQLNDMAKFTEYKKRAEEILAKNKKKK